MNVIPHDADDRSLLQAYARQRSNEAFALLVGRYADMVFRTARRRTRDHQLAEDVTQAVFIVLARTAGTFAARESIAGWLHQTTLFAASNALRARERRTKHEAQAARSEAVVDPVIDRDADVALVVEEELHRLPAADRDLLVLHYLEGRTMAETSKSLGISIDAARKRLSRGLQRLRARLAKHEGLTDATGVESALGAIALGAPQTHVAELASAAVAGGQGGNAFTLAADLMRSLRLLMLKKVAAALVLVGLGGTTIGVAVAQLAPASKPAPPPQAIAPATAPTTRDTVPTTITVRGRVVDSNDRPVAGAKITASPANPGRNHLTQDRFSMAPVAQTATGPDGRYELTVRKADVSPFTMGDGSSGADEWKKTTVAASADGMGMDWAQWDDVDANGDLVLKLAQEVPINGRIVDEAGAPIPDVTVIVQSAGATLSYQEVREIALKGDRKAAMRAQRMLTLPLHSTGRAVPIVTDAQGGFHVNGIGKGRRVYVLVRGPQIAAAQFPIETRTGEPPTPTTGRGAAAAANIYGPTFEYRAARGRTVQGTITDAVTGKPMAGVVVEALRVAKTGGGVLNEQGLLRTVTGPDGNYWLDGFPYLPNSQIIAIPNDEQPYLMREAIVDGSAGTGPITINLELHKGVWITGKVSDKVTGQPVAAKVMYTTYLNNPHSLNLPEFQRQARSGQMDGYQGRYETKPDGSYRVAAIPGPALVWLYNAPDQYRKGVVPDSLQEIKVNSPPLYNAMPIPTFINAIKKVEVPENAAETHLDLEVDGGRSMRVAVVDPDGKPTQGGYSVHGDVIWSNSPPITDITQDHFDVTGLNEGEVRTVFIVDAKRKLGAIAQVSLNEPPNRKMTLQPLAEATGRCLDENGAPLASLMVESGALDEDFDMVPTDKDGRFRILLIPGARAGIGVGEGPYAGRAIGNRFEPTPGSVTDLGDVRLTKRPTR